VVIVIGAASSVVDVLLDFLAEFVDLLIVLDVFFVQSLDGTAELRTEPHRFHDHVTDAV
jgi:hypothetical protein